MPPKPKFTKEEIVAAALELVSHRGLEGLTARELGAALGSSARPIFTVFQSMEEVAQEVRKAAMVRFEGYAADTLPGIPLFKQVGIQMVRFGTREPKLYQLLFMEENRNATTFDDVVGILGDTALRCLESIRREYGLNEAQARGLFENVWIYTFGVGALCATRMCHFGEAELGRMLTSQFQAMLHYVTGEDFHE